MSASRNAGIAASRGELIAFLDSDDVYRPEKHERQVAILRSRPRAAMVYGASQYWHSPTGEAADAVLDRPRRLGVTPDTLVEPPSLVPASASSLGSHGAGADGEICDVGRPRVGGIDVEHRTLGQFVPEALRVAAVLDLEHAAGDVGVVGGDEPLDVPAVDRRATVIAPVGAERRRPAERPSQTGPRRRRSASTTGPRRSEAGLRRAGGRSSRRAIGVPLATLRTIPALMLAVRVGRTARRSGRPSSPSSARARPRRARTRRAGVARRRWPAAGSRPPLSARRRP